jgi:hypothetical protein
MDGSFRSASHTCHTSGSILVYEPARLRSLQQLKRGFPWCLPAARLFGGAMFAFSVSQRGFTVSGKELDHESYGPWPQR